MKAQRGKIIVLCLCLIFAMLIISGKASKLGTYLYVRCNYTHLEEFAAEVIQTGAIPDDRYKRRDVRYYPALNWSFRALSRKCCDPSSRAFRPIQFVSDQAHAVPCSGQLQKDCKYRAYLHPSYCFHSNWNHASDECCLASRY